MSRFARSLRGALWPLTFVAIACGGGTTSLDLDPALSGTYSLQTVNGSGLPYLASQQGATIIWIRTSQLTIAQTGTWSQRVEFQTDSGPKSWNSFGGDSGTWARSGHNLNLFSTKNSKTAYTGSFSDTRLDLTAGSILFAFVR